MPHSSAEPPSDAERAGRRRPLLRLARFAPLVVFVSAAALVWALLQAKTELRFAADERGALRNASTLARALEAEFLRTLGAVDQSLQLAADAYLQDPAGFDLAQWRHTRLPVADHGMEIVIADATGHQAGEAPATDLSDTEAVGVHLKGTVDGLYIARPVADPASGRWVIRLSRRISFPDGRLAGVVAGAIDPVQIADFHSHVVLGQHGTITILGDDGVVRVRSPDLADSIGRSLPYQASVRLAGPEGETWFKARSSFDGLERIYVERRIGATALRVMVGQALDEVLAEARKEARWHTLAGTVATAWLLALLGLMLWSQRGMAAARDRAEAEKREKSRFLAVMSHEIRTPLGGVVGLADLLSSTALDPRQRALVDTLRSTAGHLQDITRDFLEFSRLEAGRIELERVPFRLRTVAQEVVALLRPAAHGKGVDLLLGIDPALPEAHWGDPARLRQALINLVGNGIKFTDKGSVTLALAGTAADDGSGRMVRISVIDTGCGISPEAVERIFTEFAQADASVSRRFGGSGLGLSITRRLVGAMGGRIEVASTEGRGTRFDIHVPLAEADAADVPEQAAEERAGPLPFRLRILLAEDNATSRFVLGEQLALLGQHVDVVTDGEQAVEAVRSTIYDLVLMDVTMPVMDGLAACRAIRALGGVAALTRIVALTASTSEEEIEATRAAGMDAFLAKPITRVELGAFLRGEHVLQACMEPPGTVPEPPPSRPESPPSARYAAVASHALAELERDIGADGLESVLTIFVEECKAHLVELRAALADRDYTRVHRIAHSIKGSSAGLGFRHLSELAMTMESQVRSGETEDLAAGLAAIEGECWTLQNALDRAA